MRLGEGLDVKWGRGEEMKGGGGGLHVRGVVDVRWGERGRKAGARCKEVKEMRGRGGLDVKGGGG